MATFTLDTNCIIDIDENRASAGAILELVRAHGSRCVDIALVAVSASERQQGDYYLHDYEAFQSRLASLDLGDLPHIPGMAYYDISYWDHALYASEEAVNREREIHEFLFPNINFLPVGYAPILNIAEPGLLSRDAKKWRNAWCDRQMIWAHEHHKREFFVTSDNNFFRMNGHQDFLDITVIKPIDAVSMLV